MGPQAAVAAPASRVMATMPTVRVSAMFTPSPRATSSPRLSRLTEGSVVSASSSPAAMKADTGPMTSKPTPVSEPAFQNRRAFSEALSVSATAVVIAARNTVTPCPASASVSGLPAPRPMLDSPNTTTPATAAPAKPNQTYWNGLVKPKAAIPDTTANEAPEFTPRRPVSAMGLRVYPWISAPATPSAMPATTARTVRGTRTVCTMSLISVSRWSDSGAANSPCQTSAGLSARAPTASEAAAATRRSAASSPRPATRRRRASVGPRGVGAGRSTSVVVIAPYINARRCRSRRRPCGPRRKRTRGPGRGATRGSRRPGRRCWRAATR